MTVYALDDDRPAVPDSCFIAPDATVIGDVSLADDCSVWPHASVRGDSGGIEIGARTNVQDGVVVHTEPERGAVIGRDVTVGHQAIVHACTVADEVLIGMDATVLSGAEVGEHCIIAAGALVTEEAEIPPRSVVMGVPGTVVRDVTDEEIEHIRWNAATYVEKKDRYRDGLEQVE